MSMNLTSAFFKDILFFVFRSLVVFYFKRLSLSRCIQVQFRVLLSYKTKVFPTVSSSHFSQTPWTRPTSMSFVTARVCMRRKQNTHVFYSQLRLFTMAFWLDHLFSGNWCKMRLIHKKCERSWLIANCRVAKWYVCENSNKSQYKNATFRITNHRQLHFKNFCSLWWFFNQLNCIHLS